MTKNRSQGKIDKLPESIRKQVENKLLEGYTYKDICEYLSNMGHKVSQSGICRFGKPFLQKFESVRMAKEFAQLLTEDNAERPTTELHEANNALISQIVMQTLVDNEMPVEEKLKAAKSIAILQQAQVQNERLKIVSRKEAGAVKTAMSIMRDRIFKEVLESYPDLAAQMIQIVDEIEQNAESV